MSSGPTGITGNKQLIHGLQAAATVADTTPAFIRQRMSPAPADPAPIPMQAPIYIPDPTRAAKHIVHGTAHKPFGRC
jgi:hypothetical protein